MLAKKANALKIENFPLAYQRYLSSELGLAKRFVGKSDSVLDVGCGKGRAVPFLAPVAKKYVGIDNDSAMVDCARKVSGKYPNASVMLGDACALTKLFGSLSFDKSVCLFNTLGCLDGKSDLQVLKQIASVTRSGVFLSVIAKGNLKLRLDYYEKLGIPFSVDSKAEKIHSPVWGVSKAYSRGQIGGLARKAGFVVEKVLLLEDIAFAVFLRKKQ